MTRAEFDELYDLAYRIDQIVGVAQQHLDDAHRLQNQVTKLIDTVNANNEIETELNNAIWRMNRYCYRHNP